VTVFSGEYARLYGLHPDHPPLPHEEWLQLVHPLDRERVEMALRKSIEDTHSWDAEFRVIWPDGSTHWLFGKGEVLLDESGAAVRMAGVNLDITDRKQAEAELRESEERFRRVFEEGPLGLALEGRDHRFEKVNNALCKMVGYDSAELSQMSFVDITHPDDVQMGVELGEKLFNGETPFYNIQKRYVKKTGEIIWVNLTKSIILGPDGEPLHGLAMAEDITEIKRAQEQALFRQKLESVGTLAGGIAHDFNNLLGAIQAQAELALTELDQPSSCKEELITICETAMRGSEIVRQLMIYGGKESAVIELVDLSKVVEEMLSLLKVSVTKRAVIEANLDQALPTVRASPAQLRQIVMNLITNASDALVGRDGIIRVITRRATLEVQSIAISSGAPLNGAYVILEVSDTGSGMSAETQARVFDPFFTTKSAGRGLGLAVVQGIVRSLGGGIAVTSEPSRGSTFQVWLPCEKATAVANARSASPGGGEVPGRHGTVLVAEDESYLRQAVVKMLRKSDFDVFEAGDGSSAIDLLRSDGDKIDVILLDMTMPGATSGEIIAQAANVRPGIKVILTSAHSQETVAGGMKHTQIHSFIRKPFRLADLLKVLRSCLS
jgi:PAS domain S-box-containing protein